MFVPFITKRSETNNLYRRKGGGGKGGGGGGGGKSSGSGGGSSGGSAGRAGTSVSTGSGAKSALPYAAGGGAAVAIGAGLPFAGRTIGGGSRTQVYGNQQYGSGYPGVAGRGVAGRSFPFGFWPLAWGGAAGVGTGAYLYNHEYGRYDNSSRPGGIMMTAAITSATVSNNVFRVLSDNFTVTSLLQDINTDCGSQISSPTTIVPTTYNDSLASPKPEQVVEYYRASSISLTLDGYNNTAVFAEEGAPDVPLPTNIDTNLLSCLNTTIGNAAPLLSGSQTLASPSGVGLVLLAYMMWLLSGSL